MGNELLSVPSSLKHCYNCISKAHFAKGKIIRKGGQTHLTQIQIRCETNNSTDSAQMGNVVPRAPQLGSFSTGLLFTFQTLVFHSASPGTLEVHETSLYKALQRLWGPFLHTSLALFFMQSMAFTEYRYNLCNVPLLSLQWYGKI